MLVIRLSKMNTRHKYKLLLFCTISRQVKDKPVSVWPLLSLKVFFFVEVVNALL